MSTNALLHVTEDFGRPLLVKHTFFHFELYRSETPRALSAPPKVFFSKAGPIDKIEKKKRARYEEEEDIDKVLRLGREQVGECIFSLERP